MAIAKELLEELGKRRSAALAGGGPDKAEKRHQKGQLTARERLDLLFMPETFQEFGLLVRNAHGAIGDDKYIPADGVITGVGYCAGKPVAAYAQDFTASGGSLGSRHARKIANVQEFAVKAGMPIVGVNDSGGARIQEATDALNGYGDVFYRNVLASGVVPQIALIMGPCAGGAVYSPALMDFLVMTRENANMFICGPQVIKAVTGENCTMDDIGSAKAHTSVSGNVHFIAEDDRDAIAITQRILSFLPSNNMEEPPHRLTEELVLADDPEIRNLIPETNKAPMDVLPIINRLVDGGDFLEVHKDFAKNMVVGWARVGGVVVGIIANQPGFKAGCIDIDASDKGSRFIRFCNAFNIPLLNLVDTPGYLPGVKQERGGIIRHGAKLLFAYSAATVPKVTLVMRKAYGGAYLAMCPGSLGADIVFAWPTAEIAVMGADGAVNVLYGKEIKAAKDPEKARAAHVAEYTKEFQNPYQAAGKGQITDVIDPARTRAAVALALRTLLSKRETRPPKKHGNIPL
jgi:propionyl-CoA carboxylase beta chain